MRKLAILITIFFVGCSSADKGAPVSIKGATVHGQDVVKLLNDVTIPDLPDWTNKYSALDKGDMRFFRIKLLMERLKISRLEAVEVQNLFRDRSRAGVATIDALSLALEDVKSGRLESAINPSKVRAAPFVVVFDLDETLYQQYYKSGSKGEAWRDFSFKDGAEERFVKLAPKWEEAIHRIHDLGGLVMIFTANRDEVMWASLGPWKLGVNPIERELDGIMSNSYLVRQEKNDGDPIAEPSKDLRLIDEALEKTIIIDDNPTRIVQHNRLRLVKKFQADQYLSAKNENKGVSAPFESTMPTVVHEIEESLQYVKQNSGVSFATAFLPYTMLGRVAFDSLVAGGMKPEQARSYIRRNPDFVDKKF